MIYSHTHTSYQAMEPMVDMVGVEMVDMVGVEVSPGYMWRRACGSKVTEVSGAILRIV